MGGWLNSRHVYIHAIAKTTEDCLVCHQYERSVAEDNVPSITLQEVLSVSAKPHGKFEVLLIRLEISHSTLLQISCKAGPPKLVICSKKKHIQKRGI